MSSHAVTEASPRVTCESEIVGLCFALGADRVRGVSAAERALPSAPACARDVEWLRARITAGDDPLGNWLCGLRSPTRRRHSGATYTPHDIVTAMLGWAEPRCRPTRVVDPGTGSGRFLVAAARTFPDANLIGIDIDPLSALIARANLAVTAVSERAEIVVGDFRELSLGETHGPTLFIGNPPYVRHHDIDAAAKDWLRHTATEHSLRASGLSGLHAHFFLATRTMARAGDVGIYITAAEWLDVNYGSLIRELLAGPLGLSNMFVFDPGARPFADAQTTAVITGFEVGAAPAHIDIHAIDSAAEVSSPRRCQRIPRSRLADSRWSALHRPLRSRPTGHVELGELCRVHRGQVTGCNRTWIVDSDERGLPPGLLAPVVSRAAELFAAAPTLDDIAHLRRLVTLPADLDTLSASERSAVDAFIARARAQAVHLGYIARHRKPWWAVKLRQPAPILASYMARRPPAFVRNPSGAGHVNIAHGIYPREPLSEPALDALSDYLARTVSMSSGRTYAGGLTKFEPREMERLWVPAPDRLTGAGHDGQTSA